MPSNKNTARPTFTYFSSNCMLPGLLRWCQWQRTCLPMQEMWETPRVPPLGREDLSEKETATPSSVLAWEIPWTEEPGGLQSMGSQKLDTTERLNSNKAAVLVNSALGPQGPYGLLAFHQPLNSLTGSDLMVQNSDQDSSHHRFLKSLNCEEQGRVQRIVSTGPDPCLL